jgi:hypothetical protein
MPVPLRVGINGVITRCANVCPNLHNPKGLALGVARQRGSLQLAIKAYPSAKLDFRIDIFNSAVASIDMPRIAEF